MIYWEIIKEHFNNIIQDDEYYNLIYKYLSNNKNENNVLLYGYKGFITDLFIENALKNRFNTKTFYKNKIIKNKITYIENQHYFEINLEEIAFKELENVKDFILNIIKNKNINNKKHIIIIKSIELLKPYFNAFKIILEKYSNNCFFICTTYKIHYLEDAIKSRFNCIRIPLFTHEKILNIYKNYLKIELCEELKKEKSRDIIKCLFLSSYNIKINITIKDLYKTIIPFRDIYFIIIKNKKNYKNIIEMFCKYDLEYNLLCQSNNNLKYNIYIYYLDKLLKK